MLMRHATGVPNEDQCRGVMSSEVPNTRPEPSDVGCIVSTGCATVRQICEVQPRKQIAAVAFAERRCSGEDGHFALEALAGHRQNEIAMSFRLVVLSSLLLWDATSAYAQVPPTPPETGRVFCEQDVSYRLADTATVAEPYRRFLGVWSDAAWDANTCAALIVENVDPDGTVSVIYVFGPLGSSAHGPGGVLHGTGVIRNDELRFQNSDGTQFAFRPGIADLIGRITKPNGQSYEAAFKKTF
jgi:hypothetical protein